MKDYYAVLEISSNATEDEIKKAYRKQALKYHPDKNQEKGAEDRFKEVTEAYEILSDSNSRAIFDRGEDPRSNGNGMSGNATQDIFDELLRQSMNFMNPNQQRRRQVKRGDSVHQIRIKLSDAHIGVTKKLKVHVKIPCLDCMGTCNTCGGRGVVLMQQGQFITQCHCEQCSGSGQVGRKNLSCKICLGKGSTLRQEICTIDIPKCVVSGYHIKQDGLGDQPKNKGEIPGDLLFQIIIDDDPYFKRENGNDLVYIVPLTFKESIVGKEINIPHFDGVMVENTIGFGVINPKKRYAFKKKGLGNNGDLVLQFDINYPEGTFDTDLLNTFRSLNF
jgi:molecular chaperone DnaJ